MKIEDIVSEWDKDSKIDETELGTESTKIPAIHNKYLKVFMSENVQLKRMYGQRNKLKMKLMSYYLGEMDSEELEEFNRDQFYKKLLKTEVETYIEADDLFIETNLKVVMQEEKVNYLENVLKSINSRGFQIKNAIDWIKFTHG
jgi:hypothetical protein